MEIDIRVDKKELDKLQKGLSLVEKQFIPVTTAKALTFTAERAQKAIKANIAQVFDRPTKFTRNATRIEPASKAFLEASVYLKDMASGAPHYLQPHIDGGARRQKRSERRLGYWTVIGKNAKKNQFGNLTRDKYNKIISDLQLYSYQDAAQNTKLRNQKYAPRSGGGKGKGVKYFSTRNKSGKLVVYEKVGGKRSRRILPTLVQTSKPRYRRRLRFYAIVRRVYNEQFNRLWIKQMNRELKRAGLR